MNAAVLAERTARRSAAPCEHRDLRTALGRYATGVTVVTTRTAGGDSIGVTINSFASVSLEPAIVLWSLARNASSIVAFRAAAWFAVNVLAADQLQIAARFAASRADRFSGVACEQGLFGLPLLSGSLAHFVCRTASQIEAGDHVVFLGALEYYRHFAGEPLLFQAGRYHAGNIRVEAMFT